MSNIAVFNPSAVPAFAKKRELSAVAKALAGGGDGGGNRISIKGGTFRLVSGGKEIATVEERYLDIVIVNAAPKIARVFYAAKYDADKAGAPTCWSPDGDKPSADSSDKQAETCNACPQNIAGSGQGNSRACRYQQRLAVVLANNQEGDVLQLALPATSIFGKEEGENRPLQAYARWLAAQNVDPSEVVTRMKFDTKSESPKLFFKAMRWLTEDEFPNVKAQGESADALKAITLTVAKMDNAPVSTPVEETLGKRPAGVKAAPVVTVEEAEEDEAPAPAPKKSAKASPQPVAESADDLDEPVVRKEEKKATAVPAKKASLAAAVADWDDE